MTQLDKANESIDKAASTTQDRLGTIDAQDNQLERLREKVEELDKDKISFITVSGIFLAIFTFVSVEIQFFKYICDFFQIVGFTFIFSGTLILFIFLLDYVARSWINNGKSKYTYTLFVVFLVSVLLIGGGLKTVQITGSKIQCQLTQSK